MEELLNFIDTARDARELKRALAVKLTLEGYVHAEIIKIFDSASNHSGLGKMERHLSSNKTYGMSALRSF
jgi:transposase